MSLEELDEHERSERVREWVRKNVGSIALGVLAGIGAIYGLEQWGALRERNAGLAGDEYRAYAEAVTNKDVTAIATLGKGLRDKYPESPYAALSALNDAAAAVTEGKPDDAIASLEWAEAHATMPEMKSLAMLRRARLLLAAGKADAALDLAKKIETDGFKPLAAEVRGDALIQLKRQAEAVTAYDEALVGLDSGAARRSIVEMKRDDLAGVKAGS
jgi:predicted negative regulator of RcsB-dependent stress response